jgi:hypothetical protein
MTFGQFLAIRRLIGPNRPTLTQQRMVARLSAPSKSA